MCLVLKHNGAARNLSCYYLSLHFKMNCRNIASMIIIVCVRVIWSDKRYVNYTIDTQSISVGKGRQACAQRYAGNEYLAVKVNDETGACEGLTWSWGSNQQYDTGYSYLRKIKTIEIYQPPKDVSGSFDWLIPGSFGVGGKLECYITTPEGGTWEGFAIDLVDTTDVNFNVYGGPSETVMLHMLVLRQHNELVFKTWVFGWTNKLSMAIPFSEGSVVKFTLLPHADVLQVLMDDSHLVQYSHTVDPTTAKLFSIITYSNTALKLHNITFLGI